MASNTADAMITRWVEQTRNPEPNYRRIESSNIIVGRQYATSIKYGLQYDPIYSYGTHFELGRWVKGTEDHRGFWLLNGDTYGVTTSRHQSALRNAVQRTGDSVLILPFQTLDSAGIDKATIRPVEITKDREVPDPMTVTRDKLSARLGSSLDYYIREGNVTDHGDGTFTWHRTRHILGESVIAATYTAGRWDTAKPQTTYFLSGFDSNERHAHYFLAQLPAGAEPTSVKDAFEILRPEQVREADAQGVTVTRQGDVFAVPMPHLTTRELTKLAPRTKATRLLGLSHVATEVITARDGMTYARGTLTHRPLQTWRAPEHRRQRMGDGKTWHLIVKNTVPVDERGESRAWSKAGNVD